MFIHGKAKQAKNIILFQNQTAPYFIFKNFINVSATIASVYKSDVNIHFLMQRILNKYSKHTCIYIRVSPFSQYRICSNGRDLQ